MEAAGLKMGTEISLCRDESGLAGVQIGIVHEEGLSKFQ